MQTKKVTRPDSTYVSEQPAKSHEVDLEGIDELLDDIDRVLEENAYDFVAGYIQKGGE
jgi:ubiquitin-like protein Pup